MIERTKNNKTTDHRIPTEERNPRTLDLDEIDVLSLLRRLSDEDLTVAGAVRDKLEPIASAVVLVAKTLQKHGRVVYIGAGTSGRICELDAASCRSTYGWPTESLFAIQAGQRSRIDVSGSAEDDSAAGVEDITQCSISDLDVVVGLSASGNTPYVVAAIETAARLGAATVGITSNSSSKLARLASIAIVPETGPEAIAGSTRLKAATAQKFVLNMISTGAMVQIGRTYSNLMVDMRPETAKLDRRALEMICMATGSDAHTARQALDACGDVKTAILHVLTTEPPSVCETAIRTANGHLRRAVASLGSRSSRK